MLQIKSKTALVTGANSGIGLELTKKLLKNGWQVAALIRSDFPEEDLELQERIRLKDIRIYRCDLSDFKQLKLALRQIKEKEPKLDALFNNAGGSFAELSFSPQGRELHYEIQTVVPFIITMEFLDLLKRGNPAIVIQTSTNAFKFKQSFVPEELAKPEKFQKLIGPYATSKLAVTLWTYALAPELKQENVTLISIDPGNNNTMRKGRNGGLPLIIQPFIQLFGPHPSTGADRLYAGLKISPDQAGVYISNKKPASFKFKQHAATVLSQVKTIYENEYISR
ncbi:SDR family NAD(P)-dependent oxidoreductase [Bacillus mesophilum]|uniref:SDR family NAD(P)-dependent oxidoreductase n=1 Tax=Bacillus mesophilum TaxID=1071718 RepID=A0A7V7RJY1_9BACI|nr:SDR family NAD(P)-dependent oxidoreductase [Bacillus mesophilum]KAB2331326.1 SDR family NAD(P)-dependent oxidoreductase [Bacillus mesophilum]